MKRISAILLVLCLMLAFVACGGGNDTSKDESKSAESGETSTAASETESKEESKTEESKPEEVSKEESKTDESKDDESKTETSEDETSGTEESTPEETSTEPRVVEFTNKFITWNGNYKTGMTGQRIGDATSLPLSRINEEVEEGDVGIFTREFGYSIKDPLQDYADFRIGVFEYDHTIFSYKLVSMSAVGEGDPDQDIPDDGYVLAIYKTYSDKADKMVEASSRDGVIFFPHGITINHGLDTTISRAGAAPEIDGRVGPGEYGNVVWDITPDDTRFNYAQFAAGNYYATAEVYMDYDDTYLYIAVVVSSPYHYNPCKQSDASGMWQYECIQVNTCACPADSDYISENWDNVVNAKAVNEGVVRQYGFAVNGDGDTIQCLWMGDSTLEAPITACSRDDGEQKTYYEAAIPFSSIGKGDHAVTGTAGTRIGVSVSVNSTNQEDKSKSVWKNIILRDGGGIISINDWSKIPTITLG